MPKTLSEDADEIVRQLITDQWGQPNVPTAGYNAQQTNPDADDFLPVTTDWAGFGDTYPIISLTNTDPTVPGGGDTGVTGVQGDGSGSNQRRLETMTMTVMVEDDEGIDAKDVASTLYDHAFEIVWENQHAPNHTEVRAFYATPGTNTTSGDDSELTQQYSGNVTVDWLKTP